LTTVRAVVAVRDGKGTVLATCSLWRDDAAACGARGWKLAGEANELADRLESAESDPPAVI
jgi:hypothetical protein